MSTGPALQHNIGAFLKAKCVANARLVAAGTGDATEVVSAAIDTKGYESCKIVIAGAVDSQTADKVLNNVYLKTQFCDTAGGSYDTPTTLAGSTTVVSGTGAQVGEQVADVNLAGNKRYMQVVYKPDSTASGTDTAQMAAIVVLGGANVLPAA